MNRQPEYLFYYRLFQLSKGRSSKDLFLRYKTSAINEYDVKLFQKHFVEINLVFDICK